MGIFGSSEEYKLKMMELNNDYFTYKIRRPEQKQKCPVCKGRGLVPHDFYSSVKYGWVESSTTAPPEPNTCRTCGGKGII